MNIKIKDLQNFLSGDNFRKFVIALGIIGIVLIFASNFLKKHCNSKENKTVASINMQTYAFQLEENLKNMISSIKGAGNSKVLVTLENSEETIYATEEKKNKEATEDKLEGQTSKKKESNDTEKKYLTVKDADGTERALSVTQIQPTIKGVVVVCDGGDNPDVQKKVVGAIMTALNITSKRVYVTK